MADTLDVIGTFGWWNEFAAVCRVREKRGLAYRISAGSVVNTMKRGLYDISRTKQRQADQALKIITRTPQRSDEPVSARS